MTQTILQLMAKIFGYQTVHAHCDIPCGIYDPHQALIGALTVIRMDKLMDDIENADHDHDHDIARMTAVKEEHAEMVKHEVRVIWGDFFKPEHTEKYPDLHELVFNIMHTASKARQGHDAKVGEELLEQVNKFAEIFWKVKGVKTKRVAAPYEPKSEVVYPDL